MRRPALRSASRAARSTTPPGVRPSHRPVGGAVVASCLALFAAGCADGTSGVAGEGTLAGPDRPFEVEVEPVHAVGALEGADWETFSDVQGVAFDEAGNLHVFDPENHRVVVVGPDGGHLRTVGRAGEGPGELQSPQTLGVTRTGRVVIGDVRAQAFHRFSAEGGFEGQTRFEGTYGFPVSDVRLAPGGDAVVAAGRGIVIRSGPGGAEAEDPDFVPVRRISLDDGSDSTIYRAWLPPEPGEGERETFESEGGNRLSISMSRLEAFRPSAHVAVLPDGGVVVADSTDWSLDVLESDGTYRETIRRPLEPTPVDDRIRRLERERRLAALDEASAPRLLGGDFEQEFREMRRRQVENMVFADVVPVIADLAVDWEGRIWVERSGDEPGEEGPIDIVGADGTYHGTIPPGGLRLPDAFGPDGLVAYVETDEFDVPRVEVRRITTPIP